MTAATATARSDRVLRSYAWFMVAFMIAPAAILIPVSFNAGTALTFPPSELSLRWYENLVDQPRWRNAAVLSLQIALVAALAASVIGTLVAIGIARLGPALGRSLKLVFVAPMIVPLMVMGVGFYVQFAGLGILGTRASLVAAHTVLILPFVVIPVTARLMSLDPLLELAAAASGAGAARTLWRIILPPLLPAALAGFVFAFIFSFDEVVVAQFLTGPTLETLPRRMWEGIAIGGLDNTITAVTTIQVALAIAMVGLFEIWRRRRPASSARRVASPVSSPTGDQPTRPQGERRGVGITFESITKRYGDHVAVDEVSLTVEPGEFLTLLGPSGSGKTTLLMQTAGFVSIDSGRLLIGGDDVSSLPPHRRDIGVVFQHYALFPHLDVWANVGFPLEARGMAAAEAKRRVAHALDLVHLTGFGDRRVSELSGGQQQRVALARAIVFGPRALLMDEPLAALDRNLRAEMQIEIRRLQRELGQTVIFVTHDQEEALNLSDRIAVMRDGRIEQVGSPKGLYLKPVNRFVAGFFGEANLLSGTASGRSLSGAWGDATLPLPIEMEGPTTLCIRPELVEIAGTGREGWPRVDGTIAQVTFQGAAVRILVDTPLGPIVALKPQHMLSSDAAAGERVALGWDPTLTHAMREP